MQRIEIMVRTFRAILPVLDGEPDAIHNLIPAAVLELLTGQGLLPKSLLSASIGEQLRLLETLLTGCVNDPSATSKLGQNLKAMRHAAFPLKKRLAVDTRRVPQLIEFDGSQPGRPFLSKRPASMQLRLDQTITALSAFAGLLSDSTTRGHEWRFLDIGRRLEPALQTIERRRHGLGRNPVEPSHMDLVLLIADSSITYRSPYLTALRSNYVLELLLLDESNPRSIAFQLAALVELTGKLPHQHSSSAWRLEKRLAHQPLSAVRVAHAPDLISPRALEVFLNILLSDLHDLSEALTGRYLSHVMPSRLTAM
ncbi:MAG: alpha-E domain-containing protein [Acidobacteriota bacterium]|jgi:uncharacterized alpha-E superfamily protein